jgi:hypothetical protein
MLPKLGGTMSRNQTPLSPGWPASRPTAKPTAPAGGSGRRATPPTTMERSVASLRGGARDGGVTLAMARQPVNSFSGRELIGGSRPQIRPTGGSRGLLGTSKLESALATRPRATRTPVASPPTMPSAPSLAMDVAPSPTGGAVGSSSSSSSSSAVDLSKYHRASRSASPVCEPVEEAAPPAPSSSSSSSSSHANSGGGGAAAVKCDKCDGKHPTDRCPHFKKERDNHPDARRASEKKLLGMASGPVEILKSSLARVVRQPGDGSCLFHSMAHGLRDGSSASSLRRDICNFINEHPTLEIADSPLKEWILWDSGTSVSDYCAKMKSQGVWGGGVEMAAASHLKGVNVYVYQQSGGGYKRISCFEGPGGASSRAVRVLYGGGVHYDALELTNG